ncbi:MAG: polysaccharide deacetylase family protein, partial [Chthoniobacterales bacterium]
ALCVAACAQERSDVALRSGSSSALHPHSPSISVTSEGVAPRPPRVPAQYNSVNMSRPIVALTFDDGPHPELTPKLLDILRQNGVRATFYVIGRNVETYPDIARRIVAEGHEIANHSWSHPALTSLSAGRLNSEIANTSQVIQRVTGRRPTNMRPPYGAINDRVRASMLREHGLDVIMWSVDPLDWKRPGAEVVRRRLVDGATPGGILLAHDIHPGTIEAVPGTIQDLKAKGYGFATVSQLLALQERSVAQAQPPAAAGDEGPAFQ